MTHDPYDTDNRIATGTTPENDYVRRPYGTGYGGSGIAFLIFGVVASVRSTRSGTIHTMALIVMIAVAWLVLATLAAAVFAILGRAGLLEDRALTQLADPSEYGGAA